MSNTASIVQLIVRFRYLRPLIDLVVLLIVASLFIHLQSMSVTHNAARSPIKLTAAPNKPLDMQITEESHNTEAEMWQAWASWVQSTHAVAGHCTFKPQNESGLTRFHMLCFGSPAAQHATESPRSPLLPGDSILFPNPIFIEPSVPVKPPIKDTAPRKATPPYKIQGWLNTAKGRKHFDPIQKKWLP